jgi:hypothetical protein
MAWVAGFKHSAISCRTVRGVTAVVTALLVGLASANARSEAPQDAGGSLQHPLLAPLPFENGSADLEQAPVRVLGQQLAMIQVAPRLEARLPPPQGLIQAVMLTGPKASNLPWWSGMACPDGGAAGTWRASLWIPVGTG